MLKPEDFSTGIAIMSQDGHDYKLKYSRRTDLQHSCHMLLLQNRGHSRWSMAWAVVRRTEGLEIRQAAVVCAQSGTTSCQPTTAP